MILHIYKTPSKVSPGYKLLYNGENIFLFREMGLLMTLMISHGTLLLKSTENYSGYKGFRHKYPSKLSCPN